MISKRWKTAKIALDTTAILIVLFARLHPKKHLIDKGAVRRAGILRASQRSLKFAVFCRRLEKEVSDHS